MRKDLIRYAWRWLKGSVTTEQLCERTRRQMPKALPIVRLALVLETALAGRAQR